MYKVYPFAKLVSKDKLNSTPYFVVEFCPGFENFAEKIKLYTNRIVDKNTIGYYIGYSYKNKKNKISGLLLFNNSTVNCGTFAHEALHACLGILNEQGFKLENLKRDLKEQEVAESSIEEVLAYMMDATLEQLEKINDKI